MRKYIRKAIRETAGHEGKKPSKWVREVFNQIQIKKYGVDRRTFNMAKGTHKRSLWFSRFEMFTSK